MSTKSDAPRFSKATLDFIKKAGKQKNPLWLDHNREEYEALLLEPFQHLAKTLKEKIGPRVPDYHFPMKGIGRLKRGGSFRDWVSYTATRPTGSRFDHNPSLFFMINPMDEDDDTVLVAGGLYMPSSRQLRAIREAIAQDASAFDELFAHKAFKARFSGGFSLERSAKRPPRGFDPEHPRLEWLKLQGYYVWRTCSMKDFSSSTFAQSVAQDWEQALRLNALLESAIAGRWKSTRLPDRTSERLGDWQAPLRQMDF